MRKKKQYKDSDWDLYVWPDPPSGDPEDYGPTEMQEEVFIYHKEPWERPHNHTLDIVLMVGGAGSGKSWKRGTGVLLQTGEVKNVEDIKIGDVLLGPDSKPRTVLSLGRGKETFYKVTPVKGEPFYCNESHILSLKKSGNDNETRLTKSGRVYHKPPRYGCYNGDIVNVSIKDYLNWSTRKKKAFKLYRSGAVEFLNSPTPKDLEILPPYILGLWLGDGNSNRLAVTTMDDEIMEEIISFAKSHNLDYSVSDTPSKAITVHVKGAMGILKGLGLRFNKHIPHKYKISDIESRRQLLAGLIDTDGYHGKGVYEIAQKNKELAEGILFVARSLGLAAYVKEVNKSCPSTKGTTFTGKYYKITISGDLSQIPTRLKRKQVPPRGQVKDVLVTGFSLERLPEDDYYGFSLDGDHLFLLKDFTVVHNSIVGIANTIELVAAFPKCVAICAGKNMPLLKRNVVDKFGDRLSWTSPEGITYPWQHPLVLKAPAEKTPFATFKNGSSIRFLNIDDPDIVRGFTADLFLIEEVNLMKADALKEMFRRSRGTALPVRQFILNMNPTGRRDWVYDMFNFKQYTEDYKGPPLPIGEPCECQYCHTCSAANKGKHEWVGGEKKVGPNGRTYAWVGGECHNPECPTFLKKGTRQKKTNECPGNQHYYRVVRSASIDNPHLPSDFAQLQRGALSDEEYATYVEGKIVDLNTGTIYKEFSSENIVECEFNPEEDIYWTMDFNFDPMCSIICQEREEGLFCVDEFTLWNADEMDVARAFCKRYQGYKGKVWLFGDPNGVLVVSRADSSRESFKVIYEYLKSQGFDVEMGFKKVKGDTLIPIISRINNLKASIKNVEGIRRIFVSPNCFNLIESLKGTVWKETSPTPKEDDNCDDVARGNPRRASEPVLMTHPQAALGYLVFKRFPVILRKKGVRLLESAQTSIVEKGTKLLTTDKQPLPPPEEEVFDPYKPQSLASMFGLGTSILEERLAYEKAERERLEKSSQEKVKNFQG